MMVPLDEREFLLLRQCAIYLKLMHVLLQSALNSEVKGRSEDKTAAAAALQQQLAAKAKELQKAAQQLAVADQQYKSLQEAGQKQSAHAHAAALAEAAERLSQTQQAHVQEVKSIQEGHAKLMNIHSQKHEEEMKALQKVKSKVCNTRLRSTLVLKLRKLSQQSNPVHLQFPPSSTILQFRQGPPVHLFQLHSICHSCCVFPI